MIVTMNDLLHADPENVRRLARWMGLPLAVIRVEHYRLALELSMHMSQQDWESDRYW